MKLLASLVWASLALRPHAVSEDASIYIQDHVSEVKSIAPSISPNTARLLFAQRLGLSQYHEIGDADEKALDILNKYGGHQPSLFMADEESREQSTDKLLFIIEGVEFPEDLMEHNEKPSITVTSPPNTAQNAKLAQDLLEQALHAGSGKTMSHIKHNLSLQGLSRSNGHRYTHAITTLKTILKTYHHQMPHASRTIVLMPPTNPKSKRSSSPYGSYTMPLTRRYAQTLHQHQQQESPLEEPPSPPPSNPDSPSSPSATPSPLPPGIPKICHPTSASAETSTNNCSSHGTVYLRSPGANGNPDCWTCKCSSTAVTTTDADGTEKTKTTYWGGAACQKKDVSSQFWLLAGVTVGLLAVVGWGIGLLVDVGGGELPGVLGAGVGGPRAMAK